MRRLYAIDRVAADTITIGKEVDRVEAEMRAKGYVPTWDLYAKDTEFDKFGRAWRLKAFVPDVAKFVVV